MAATGRTVKQDQVQEDDLLDIVITILITEEISRCMSAVMMSKLLKLSISFYHIDSNRNFNSRTAPNAL